MNSCYRKQRAQRLGMPDSLLHILHKMHEFDFRIIKDCFEMISHHVDVFDRNATKLRADIIVLTKISFTVYCLRSFQI